MAAALLIGLAAADAAAQLPADARWQVIESSHFRVTFTPGLEELARHTAASAERAHAALMVLVAEAPHGRIDIVLADNIDQSNGYATTFPTNRIVLWAKPPLDVPELQYMRDWLELVVTHELAHIFHLDATSTAGRLIRAVLGRAPLPWPAFPAVGTPAWSIEGLAVGAESAVTGLGRVNGSYNDMVVRSAALAGAFDEFDRLGSSSARWPGPARSYIFGSLFMDYLARRHGADAAARVVRSTAGAVIPPPLWFGRIGTDALGVTFRDAYADWQTEVEARSDSIATLVAADGLTSGVALTAHRAIATHPRFSRDGRRIAYAAHDWRTPARVRVIDVADGAGIMSKRVNQPAPATWLDESTLVTTDVDFTDRFRALGDLHVIGPRGRRLTRGARLQDVDASRAGRVAAIQNADGTSRVVLVDAATGDVRPVTQYDRDVHWSLPRFSRAGDRLAVSRWRTGGAYDVVVMDTLGTTLGTFDVGGVSTAPAWSADSRWLLFASDRTGISNLYAVDVARLVSARGEAAPRLRQITNVLGGAFQPDVSPDGHWIAFSGYTHDGFRIERMPFDTSTWRSPQPDGWVKRAVPQHAGSTTALADSLAWALAGADTSTGRTHRYNPLPSLRPHFWLPVIDVGSVDDAVFLGATSWGRDLLERHEWEAALAVDVASGRSQGGFAYRFRGLPTIPRLGLHPVPGLRLTREWDTYFAAAAPGEPYADEREDIAALTLDLTRARWRTSSGLGFAAERVRRSRSLYDAPPNISLVDPADDLLGLRAYAYTARYVTPPLSISPENGYTLQLSMRRLTEDRTALRQTPTGPVVIDASQRELTTWNTAYLALPLPGFARHVAAARASGLLRDGPGATPTSIGGAGGTGFRVAGLAYELGGASTLLPVRGFARGQRRGSSAWTASLEYRAPIALIDAPLRPLYFDRVSGSVFVDAGHAWCTSTVAARFSSCSSTSAGDSPLVSTGAEITTLMTVLGFTAPVRIGAGVPLRGAPDRSPRFYILSGPAF